MLDAELDTLLLRLHAETACRRGGALALRPAGLDTEQCLVRLREKGETVRWQPVSPTLMARLAGHGQERRAPPDGQLLRYATARACAGRNGTGADAGVTSTYVRADVHEVAAALAALTGEPHPLAGPERGDLDR